MSRSQSRACRQAFITPAKDGDSLLAMPPQPVGRQVRVVDETHWDGLPTDKWRPAAQRWQEPHDGVHLRMT